MRFAASWSNPPPTEQNLPSGTWTRQAIAELIERRLGVELTLQGVGKYLRRWGLTPQKPARHSREQDPEEVRAFMEQTLPEAQEQAEEEGATLHSSTKSGPRHRIRSVRVMPLRVRRRCKRYPKRTSNRM
jgi:hypothetical protein